VTQEVKNAALQVAGFWEKVLAWLVDPGIKVGITLVITIVIVITVSFLFKRIVHHAEKIAKPEDIGKTKRLKTVMGTLRIAVSIVIWVIGIISILGQVGIAIGPLLAGVGVIGMAIGFGAQNLVKDFLGGLFILIENQIRVGDVVKIDKAVGTVESVNLRTILIRGVNGHLYTVPNGEIKIVENMTMGWSRAIVKVGVGYSSNIEKVIEAMHLAAGDIKKDKEFGSELLGEIMVKAIDDFSNSSLNVSLWIKTKPASQWDVGRIARRYIKQRFEEAGIEIPFPQVTLTLGTDEAALLENLTSATRRHTTVNKT